MEETGISKWFPLHRAWFTEAMATWEDSWVAPIMRLLIAMWPAGAKMDDRDELLARTAKVPLKTWMRIRQETGLFWVVREGKFTQPFLADEFEVALGHAAKRTEKASKGGQAKQEKARQRLAEEIAGLAASSSAPSTSSSIPEASLEAHTRACGGDLSEVGEEEKRSNAKAVPKPAYVEACFQAYPRERRGKGATARIVAIPNDARVRIARFVLDRPDYPLLRVFRAIAKTMDFPPAMADVLRDPPHPDSLLRAAGDAEVPKPQTVELDAEEARREREQAEWDALPGPEKERRMSEAKERVEKTLGRKSA